MEITSGWLQYAQTGRQTDGLMGRWTERQKYRETDAGWSYLVPRAIDRLVSMDTGLKQHKSNLLLGHEYTFVCMYRSDTTVCV